MSYKQAPLPSSSSSISKERPRWIRVKLPTGKKYRELSKLVDQYKLHTICQSGHCPNMGECWGEGVATFMILGDICTRSCGFCKVKTGRPSSLDWEEPEKVARSIKLMKIQHAVITSVDRDDLKDMGSIMWAETLQAIRRISPSTTLETLIPDFQGNTLCLDRILKEQPEVISHNLETVESLTPKVRIQAKYHRSLEVLAYLKTKGAKRVKTSLMLGLGETPKDIRKTMKEARAIGVDVFTLGQYLQPSPQHLPVKEFISPEQFEIYKKEGLQMGFRHVESGPLVRSSYHAHKHIL